MNPTMEKDCYKEFHVHAYHPDVSTVYINFTNRGNKHSNIDNNQAVAFVGLQYFIKSYLIEEWNEGFFKLNKDEACQNHKRVMEAILGHPVDVTYLEELHDLGYLPLHIKALEEGTLVPYQVPCLTITNTVDGFQWLPNMIETVLSAEIWGICTSATTAAAYLKNVVAMFEQTGMDDSLIPFMCHDFSFRGMFGKQAAAMSGFGHLSSGFAGTDTIPAVLFAEKYYNADLATQLVGASVDATEHSVTCSWLEEGEIEFFKTLMIKQSPTGILSVVSDTWDFWKLVTEYLPELKETIIARDGKVVIRPDSGDPVKILCGYNCAEITDTIDFSVDIDKYDAVTWVRDNGIRAYATYEYSEDDGELYFDLDHYLTEPEVKGLIECLWDIFGGTQTDKGFNLLDDHIGAIYGDAITLKRQEEIYEKLMAKGFAPSVVLGVGSYSYQYVTRDTHSSAVKATNVIKRGVSTAIFKDPKTDPGKTSHKGLLHVDVNLKVHDEQLPEMEDKGLLRSVFKDGRLMKETTLNDIRALISTNLDKL